MTLYTGTLQESFGALVHGLKPNLKKICAKNRFLGFIDKDDLYQEALIKLWDNLQGGKLQDKTASYILRGCYFHIQNYIRTHKVHNNIMSLDEPVVSEEEGPFCLKDVIKDDTADFFGELNSRLIVSGIMNNGLTKREKDVCGLLYEGLTIREVAKRLSISHVRVLKIKQQINRKYAFYYKEDL